MARLEPPELELRLGAGLVWANWYRTTVTIPERIGDLDPTGATIVFEVVVDDYAEVWVNGELPKALGDSGGNVASGFNAPNRVVLTRDARPGQRSTSPCSASTGRCRRRPTTTSGCALHTRRVRAERARVGEEAALAVHRLDDRLDAVVPPGTGLERIATGFEFTEGPVWTDGALLFSAPNWNTIYRWTPEGRVSVFRTKSGYSGVDIGRYHQPGSNGLAVDARRAARDLPAR